jgi:chitinase
MAISLLLAHLSTAMSSGSSGNMESYLAAHPVSTQTAVPLVLSNNTLPTSLVASVMSICPTNCSISGLNPNNWTVYHQSSRLAKCNQTMLLNFALFNSLDDPNNSVTIRSCTTGFDIDIDDAGNATDSTLCLPSGNLAQVQEPLQLAFNETGTPGSLDDFEAASQQLAGFLARQEPTCNDTIAFTYSNSVAFGIFAGSGVQGILASVLQQFIAQVMSSGISKSALVQLCAANNRSSKYSFGIIANAQNDIGFVQDAVAMWASGECITTYDSAESWQNVTLTVPSLLSLSNNTISNSTISNSTLEARNANNLWKRDDCSTIQVASGDSCKFSQKMYHC